MAAESGSRERVSQVAVLADVSGAEWAQTPRLWEC